MALARKGQYSYGDGHADIQDELRDYSQGNMYLATQFADAVCSCGGKVFAIQLDDEAGAAVRICSACRREHAIGDSSEYLSESALEEGECPCGFNSFEITVGLALYRDSSDAKWLYLGLRCIRCGLIACYGDWKNEYIGYQDLLRRV